jgi:hypothetical protein
MIEHKHDARPLFVPFCSFPYFSGSGGETWPGRSHGSPPQKNARNFKILFARLVARLDSAELDENFFCLLSSLGSSSRARTHSIAIARPSSVSSHAPPPLTLTPCTLPLPAPPMPYPHAVPLPHTPMPIPPSPIAPPTPMLDPYPRGRTRVTYAMPTPSTISTTIATITTPGDGSATVARERERHNGARQCIVGARLPVVAARAGTGTTRRDRARAPSSSPHPWIVEPPVHTPP